MLTFSEEDHAYHLDGVRIPSVTQILSHGQDLSRIPAWTALRGTAFHLATEYDDEGCLDEASVDPLVRPHLDAYRAWKAMHSPEFVATEIRVWGEIDGMLFAGTIDRVIRCHNGLRIADLKSGAPRREHEPQLAAYAVAHEQRDLGAVVDVQGIYCPKDGVFAVKPYSVSRGLAVFTEKLRAYYEEIAA